jgi:2-polyprenyl-3-methyl-5-hydroxy-6-metoxy-1,4-benzoquinol methylase
VADDAAKLAELRAIVEGIKDRVRAQYPEASVVADSAPETPLRVPVADLMPIVHARDAAQAKMASIGSVNPRRGGAVNNAIQSVKRNVARGLNWFVRDQIVFNRAAIACVEATMESLNDLNRSMAILAAGIDERLKRERQERVAAEPRLRSLETHAQTLTSLPAQWSEALRAWETRESQLLHRIAEGDAALQRTTNETLHALIETQRSFEARTLDMEKSFERLVESERGHFTESGNVQHARFSASLEHAASALQDKLNRDIQAIKLDFERLIHNELRVIRQRPTSITAHTAEGADFDYQAFSHRFRGSEEYVKGGQAFYVPYFQNCRAVLDIGCGQGEFLEVMREAGISARGIDQSSESIQYCKGKGLDVQQADLFTYLSAAPALSLDGIFCSQVVEHLPAAGIPELIRLSAQALQPGGIIAIETPNPECLAIFATHFYLDPTHVKPVPSAQLAFYLQESGFGGITIEPRFPAPDFYPELNDLPEGFRKKFFGGMDYAIVARKL